MEAVAWLAEAVGGVVCGRATRGNQMREVRQRNRAHGMVRDLQFLVEGGCWLILMVGDTGERS